MRSKLEMKRPILAELSVEVPAEEINAAVNKAFATLSRKAKIRGFRQGKVPRAVLKRMFGEAVLHEVRGDIINDTLLKAFTEHVLMPISQPALDAPEMQENADYTFKATFEVRPKLDSINYEGIVLERVAVKVDEDEIDKELAHLRSTMASLIALKEPRPAATDDSATISLKRFKDGNWKEDGLKDKQIVIGEGQVPEAIESALLGMNVGDEKVVDFGSETEMEENRIRYLVRLTDLKERKLPELDDELAKDIGNYDTLESLKEDIRKRIAEAKNKNEDRRLRAALYDALCKKNPMEFPPSLVARQVEALKSQLFRGMMEGIDKESEEGKNALQRLEESALKTAEEMVHQQLLIMEIARLSNIEVKDEDIDAEIEKRAAESGLPLPMVRAEMNKGNRRDDLALQILETKIFDFVQSLVKITDVDGEGSKAAPPSDTTTEKTAVSDEPEESGTKEDEKVLKSEGSTPEASSEKDADEPAKDKKEGAKKTTSGKIAAKKTTTNKAAEVKTTWKKAASKKEPSEK